MSKAASYVLTGLILPLMLFLASCDACRKKNSLTAEASPSGGGSTAAAGNTRAESAGPPEAAEQAGPPLELKSYSPAARAKNQAVEFSIPSFSVTRTLGSRTAPSGKAFLVIDMVWKNIIPLTKVLRHPEKQDRTMGVGGLGVGGGKQEKENPDDYEMRPTPYVVPEVKDHAFVLVNGQDTALLSEANSAAPHALSAEQIVVPKLNAEVKGQLVYEIPERGVTSLVFRYLDTAYGSFDVPLFGKPPAPAVAIAGPMANDVLEVSAYGVQELARVGDSSAPAGQKYAVVQLGCTGKAEGSLVRVELENYASLRDPQGFSFTPAKDASAPGQFKGMVQFLPQTPQRGALVFQVPEQHGALTLVLTIPGNAPLELNLPNTATGGAASAAAAKPPAVLFTIPDGDTLDVQVHGVSVAANLGSAQPEEGKRFLMLDLSLVNKADQGIEFQTGEQLKLLNGEEEIVADASSMEQLPHPLKENSVVPAHGRGRFEVAYQVPTGAGKLVLYYRGFNREEKHPLTVK